MRAISMVVRKIIRLAEDIVNRLHGGKSCD